MGRLRQTPWSVILLSACVLDFFYMAKHCLVWLLCQPTGLNRSKYRLDDLENVRAEMLRCGAEIFYARRALALIRTCTWTRDPSQRDANFSRGIPEPMKALLELPGVDMRDQQLPQTAGFPGSVAVASTQLMAALPWQYTLPLRIMAQCRI
jgi:hypothetical protein